MRKHVLPILCATVAFAQRPFSATYDASRQVKVKGPVIRVDWVNPRTFFLVKTEEGNWEVEFGNPLDLERDGWKSSALRIGDVVSIEGYPAREPARQVFAISVVLARTGAKLFTASKRSLPTPAHEPAPRWPDGRVRLGPVPGKKGYWGPASTSTLVDISAGNIPMKDGLLVNLSDAARVAPFQPWAKALYEYRQRTLLRDDPYERCLPPGGPRQFQTPHGFQFIEQRELGRILVLLGGGDRNWRIIYTDGRAQGQADEAVRGYYGNSVGRWDGDTLIVDTIGFNERFWFSAGGLPHTEALHLIERFTRPDLRTLRYEVTIDDPRAYTRPWNAGWTIRWVSDEEIQEYFCEENAESTFAR
jgi:hypothetical protein